MQKDAFIMTFQCITIIKFLYSNIIGVNVYHLRICVEMNDQGTFIKFYYIFIKSLYNVAIVMNNIYIQNGNS